MTGRDRMVLIVISVVVVLGAAWMLVVSPERQQANKLAGQVAAAQAQVTAAESTVSSARAAQSQYAAAYASLVNIGKAVPPSDEVPALIDQLTQASNEKSVQDHNHNHRRQHRELSPGRRRLRDSGRRLRDSGRRLHAAAVLIHLRGLLLRSRTSLQEADRIRDAQRRRQARGERTPAHDQQPQPVDRRR
jgi:hypothetical protein